MREILLGTNLEVAYFDQHRSQLDPEKSVMDNVGDGKQDIVFQGRPRHILSYLQDFLFSPKQSRTRYAPYLVVNATVPLAKILLNQAIF